MKNLFAIMALGFTMFLGIQSSSAQSLSQDENRPEAIAKTQTAKLTTSLDLNGDQSRTVFRALVAKEVGYNKSVNGKSSSDAVSEKKRLDADLDAAMKKTLTDEQYTKWKSM